MYRLQLNIQLTQGSAATNFRDVVSFLPVQFISKYSNERIVKIGPYCQNYPKNETCTFIIAHGVD